MTGQFRPRKLIADVKNEISNAEEFDLSTVKDVAKHFINKSLYSFGLTSQFAFPPSTSLLLAIEGHGEKERLRSKVMVFHKAWIYLLVIIFHYLLWNIFLFESKIRTLFFLLIIIKISPCFHLFLVFKYLNRISS